MRIFKGIVCFVVLSVSAFGFGSLAHSQARPSPKTQVISVDPLGMAINQPLMFQYEWKVGPIYSWAVRAYYWPSRAASSGPVSDEWSAFGVGGAYRIYIADSRALTGLSVAPAANVFFFHGSELGRSGISVWIGGDIAYKWIFDEFSIEPLIELAIGFGPQGGQSSGPAVPAYTTGTQAVIGLSGGYAW
ncbi:MAG: hypothetical protein Q8922_02255 [Bacteroidota bacterium]|nr:hypothetical protein [Bacteroidota bacterium]MDP4232303.1 hypothetical protein [Bacteroidota bacterium]MDP4241442.1 hypothetical protein [Bacteroidota bacterium]MDP4286734.1 hypothetical protein [Bacteroidota bacterium]